MYATGNPDSFVNMNIITKFTLGSGAGRDTLLQLTKELAIEKYATLLDEKSLTSYIDKNFSPQTLIAETNNMSNQWLVVYVDDVPAGYAYITSKGKRPESLEGKRAMRIADFGILQKYQEAAVRDALFEKCLQICKSLEGIWMIEYVANPLIAYFESKGFSRQKTDAQPAELPLEYVSLIK
jgi:hypothetical protein